MLSFSYSCCMHANVLCSVAHQTVRKLHYILYAGHRLALCSMHCMQAVILCIAPNTWCKLNAAAVKHINPIAQRTVLKCINTCLSAALVQLHLLPLRTIAPHSAARTVCKPLSCMVPQTHACLLPPMQVHLLHLRTSMQQTHACPLPSCRCISCL